MAKSRYKADTTVRCALFTVYSCKLTLPVFSRSTHKRFYCICCRDSDQSWCVTISRIHYKMFAISAV